LRLHLGFALRPRIGLALTPRIGFALRLCLRFAFRLPFGVTLRSQLGLTRYGEAAIVEKLAAAGFQDIEIEPTRVYSVEDARAFLSTSGIDVDALAQQVEGKFISAFVRATKPQPAVCCAPSADTRSSRCPTGSTR